MVDSSKRPVFGRRKSVDKAPSPPEVTTAVASVSAKKDASPLPPISKLSELLKIPYDRRGDIWNTEFEEHIFGGWFYELEAWQMGPDQHNYHTVCLAKEGEPNAMKFQKMGKKAMNNGLGISIFSPGNAKPDFVFTLGELIAVAMQKTLLPLSISAKQSQHAVIVDNAMLVEGDPIVFAGQVPPDWMPEPARKAMREYLAKRYGIKAVSVQSRTEMEDEQIVYQGIIFNFPIKPDCDLNYLMEDLYWYIRPGVRAAMLMGPSLLTFYPL